MKRLQVLQKSLREFNEQITGLKEDISLKQATLKQLELNTMDVLDKIERLTKIPVKISDHALIQFIRRQGLLDIDDLRENLISDENYKNIEKCGDGKYPISKKSSLKLVVKDNRVVTVIDVNSKE
jgi:hypothetical protein